MSSSIEDAAGISVTNIEHNLGTPLSGPSIYHVVRVMVSLLWKLVEMNFGM